VRCTLRQCDALRARAAAGEALTAPEREKLAKVPGWCAHSMRHVTVGAYGCAPLDMVPSCEMRWSRL